VSTIHPARLRDLGDGALLLDVRTPGEFETAHIPGAVNIPLDQLKLDAVRSHAAGRPIVLVCKSGGRAARARQFIGQGQIMAGGMDAWLVEGAPVLRGRPRWSLERQVRLAAGLLVLVSVVASLWFGPALAVAGIVGAGLTFAGATDTCVLGMALARLPYNR
jgi:rhodanese-related sulfurtransferase